MWTREKHIEYVLKEAVKSYQANRENWLGISIIYMSPIAGSTPRISDSQHRFTVYFLAFLVCCEMLGDERLLSKISQYGDDELGDEPTPEDAEFMASNEWTRIPNIRSVYSQDFRALGNVLNGRIPPVGEQDSNIYAAHQAVRAVLSELLTPAQIKPFRTFIYKNTKTDRMLITDWDFAIKVFNDLNNIKVIVPPVFLLKNAIVRSIGEQHSAAVHVRFRDWEMRIGMGAGFDQFIHLMANLFAHTWATVDKYPGAVFDRIEQLKAGGATNILELFSATVEKGFAVRQWLRDNTYARILLRFASGHEVVDHCLFPVLFSMERMNDAVPFVRAMIAYGTRVSGRFSFNASKYRGLLIGDGAPVSSLIAGEISPAAAMSLIGRQFAAWLEEEGQNFKERVASEQFKTGSQFNKAAAALLYLAELDQHEATLNHASIDIDHIFPKQPRKADPVLANPDNTHRIGNFTPFMGPNSTGLRGNRSLGNLPYVAKRESYLNSNIAMTRRIAANETWADAQIVARSVAIATQLDQITLQDLAAI